LKYKVFFLRKTSPHTHIFNYIKKHSTCKTAISGLLEVATSEGWLYRTRFRYSNHVNFPLLRNWLRPLFMATRQLKCCWLKSSIE